MTFLRPKKLLDAAALWNYALGAVGRRALSEPEMRLRLEQRALHRPDVATVIERMREYGYLNDQRLAETYAAARRDNDAHGPHRVLRDLRVRRVGPDLAREAVDQAFAGRDEDALAREHLARKFRGVDLAAQLSDPKRLASAYRKLRVAGFSGGAAVRALKQFSARADELEDAPGEDVTE